MRTLSNSRVIPWSGALCAIALLSCQTYDFEPVEPLAMAQKTDHRVVISRKSKPNMMLVVDKSGSMLLPSGSGTRLSEMKSAMQTFLSKVGTKARLGLTVFPNASDGNTCQSACPPGIVLEPITTTNDVLGDLEAQASTINARIQAINTDGPGALPAAGGTPTAATLNVVSNQPTLIDPTFVTHFPAEIMPLARESTEFPGFAEVFELAMNGQEIAPGYSELNNPDVQYTNFLNQGGEVDKDFVEALRHGMPPAGGVGIGIDRLVMALLGQQSIRDVVLFPLMKPQPRHSDGQSSGE